MAIHAIDGRLNQVAAVLQSRGKLACTLGNVLLAEQCLQTAGALLLEVNNRAGWAYTAWWLARLAAQQGKTDQSLAILRNAFERLKTAISYPSEKGRIALELSRAYWSRGDLQETTKWLEEALRLLPLERRQERKEAAALARFCGSLQHDPSLAREKQQKGL
jgi:tetratricopeptide (TPR) repeat protein